MNKNETNKDQGLRLAIQHRNETPEKMTLPDDFTDRLMQSIGQQKPEQEPKPLSEPMSEPMSKRHSPWLYALVGAVAAGILLLLAFHYTHGNVDAGKGNVVARQTEKQELPGKPESPKGDEQRQSLPTEQQGNPVKDHGGAQAPIIAKDMDGGEKANNVGPQSHAPSAISKSATNVSTTDSLDYYIDKIERELAQVDESLYIERINKVISADERLQRIVSSYILHNLDEDGRPQTADNMYNVKTGQDEK
ncbi:MAG: hypothetical protein IKH88_14785 [Prevotella sp.]|nr:hypothetical protein [Prevotella sp.]